MGSEGDPRLRLLEANWFRDKTVLDVGCGAGHITLRVARRFDPAHILGVELDKQLVHAANQNIRHFLSHDLVLDERGRSGRETALLSSPGKEERERENVKVEKQECSKEELMEEKQVKEGEKKKDCEEMVMEEEKKQVDVMEKKDNAEEAMEEFQQALSLLSFPLSFRVSRGPLSAPPLLLPPSSSSSRFPNNVTFIQVSHFTLN